MEILLIVLKFIGLKALDLGMKKLSDKILKSDEILVKFKKAILKVSNEYEDKYPGLLGDNISHFFLKDEIIVELFKLLFKGTDIDVEKIKLHFDVLTLPDNFIEMFIDDLRNELLKDKDFDEIFSSKDLYKTLTNLSDDIKQISDTSKNTEKILSIIEGYINASINKNFNYSKFYNDYKKNAVNILSQVNFFGLGLSSDIKKKRKKLHEIYVKPNFSKIKEFTEDGSDTKVIKLSELFKSNQNIVILGDPGSGKSILIKYIICSIFEKKVSTFKNKKIFDYIPFRIELRKFLAFKKGNSQNLIKYLEQVLQNEFFVPNITETKLDEILNSKDVIFFFDGLDEIFDLQEKNDIKNDIENFCNVFDQVLAIVTSRKIGYEDAKLNENFKEYEVLDFDDEQVEDYLNKWYKVEESNVEIRKREINTFLENKHQIYDELLYNPLFLSLIIILYRNNLKIPDSKLDIYKSCTKTLVDKWDEIKDLNFNLDERIRNRKGVIFSDLAFWQYETNSKTEKKDRVITNIQVIKVVERTIQQKLKLSVDTDEARKIAEEFVDYAQKRSIYFDNNFTHKTFLEYFTAYWIYTNYHIKGKYEEQNNIIAKYIDNSYWYVVLELLFNLIEQDQPDSEIMDRIVTHHLENEKSLNFLLLVLPSIKISENVIHKTLETAIRNCIQNLKYEEQDGRSIYLKKNEVYENLMKLLSVGRYSQMVESISNSLYNEYKNEDHLFLNYFRYYAESDSVLYLLLHKEKTKSLDMDFFSDEDKVRASKLHPLNFRFGYENVAKNYFNISRDFISYFGVDKFFLSHSYFYNEVRQVSYAESYIRQQLTNENIGDFENNIDELEKMGVDIRLFIKTRPLGYRVTSESNFNDFFYKVANFRNKKHVAFTLLFFVARGAMTNKMLNNNKKNILKNISNTQHEDLIKFFFQNLNRNEILDERLRIELE